jgi:hypothetical protein
MSLLLLSCLSQVFCHSDGELTNTIVLYKYFVVFEWELPSFKNINIHDKFGTNWIDLVHVK